MRRDRSIICDRCHAELTDGIYLCGDAIVGFLSDFGFESSNSIDLCETCNKELHNLIKEWWLRGEIMFDFKKFPATIRYERLNGDGEVILERDVEVFGYMRLEHLLSGGLIAFRQTDTLLKDVTLMPASEFEERFKGYVLVEE